MCNMEDLSDRDPYVSHVWNTDRHAFAAKQLQMKIFGVHFVFEIVFMQSRLCIQSWEVVIKRGLFMVFKVLRGGVNPYGQPEKVKSKKTVFVLTTSLIFEQSL